MKKMIIGVVVMLMFQLCTSELNEIDSLIGSHVESGDVFDTPDINIPSGAFLGQYFSLREGKSLVYSKVERRIRHDFNSPVKKDITSKELGAKWSGNFEFEAGTYSISIKSDKSITVSIDDEVLLENSEESTDEEVVVDLDGVHKVEVEYNLEGNASGSDGPTETGSTTGSETTTGGSTGGGTDSGSSTGGGTDTGSSTGGGTDSGSSTGGGTDAGSSTGGGTDAGSSTGGGTDAGSSTGGGTDPGSSTSGGTDTGGSSGGGTSDGIVDTGNDTPTVEVIWQNDQDPSKTESNSGGIFYTNEELEMWRNRATNGPFKSKGDAFPNSPGDWDRMVSDAATFLSNDKDVLVWKGMTIPVDQHSDGSPLGQVNDPIFGSTNALKYNRMMTAAFVDLVLGTSSYKGEVKKVLLAQAQRPGVDFSNETLFPKAGFDATADVVWTFAEWQIKFLKAYDYLGPDYFTTSEQSVMEKWFRDGAEWHQYLVNVKSLDRLYVQRGIPIEDYQFDYQMKYTDRIYRNGPEYWNTGNWHNNRRYGQINFITHVGVLLNEEAMKQTGSWAVKEWLSFWWYSDGYYMELHRSKGSRPQGGLGYGPNTVGNAVEVAMVLYHDGYENLFEYTTDTYLDPIDGSLKTGGVERSLEWAILNFKKNFLDSSAPRIFPYGSNGTNADILMHYCDAAIGTEQISHRPKPGLPASIANIYYNNDNLRNIYWGDGGGGLCGYPSNPSGNGVFNAWVGTGGTYPGYMFMYAK